MRTVILLLAFCNAAHADPNEPATLTLPPVAMPPQPQLVPTQSDRYDRNERVGAIFMGVSSVPIVIGGAMMIDMLARPAGRCSGATLGEAMGKCLPYDIASDLLAFGGSTLAAIGISKYLFGTLGKRDLRRSRVALTPRGFVF